MKKLKFLLLLGLPLLIGEARSQSYIPILGDTVVWYCAERQEFGDLWIYQLMPGAKVVYNGKTYTQINIDSPSGSTLLEIREDTLTKKVYQGNEVEEYVLYDFSLNEGDSTHTPGDNDMFYVDSVRFINYDSVIRKTIYFHEYWGDYFPVWIEGIGSTAGINRNCTQPALYWWDMPELLCCKYSNKMVFESQNGRTYGCALETLSVPFFETGIKVKLSPNPVTDVSNLTFENLKNQNFELSVFNVLGKQVNSRTTAGNSFTINKNDFPPGIYLLQLKTNQKIIYSSKFITY
jgi:hypothetical protein